MHIADNQTIIGKKEMFRLQQFSLLKSTPIMLVVALIFILLGFRIRNGMFVLDSIFFVVIGALVLPIYVAVVEIMLAKQNKKLKGAIVYEYQFFTDKIIASGTDHITSETIEVPYEKIKKFKAGKKYIIITAEKQTSLLVAKSGFKSAEDSEKVLNLLKLKVKSSKSDKNSKSKPKV